METPKYRHLTAKYCEGNGLDLGSGGEPVVPSAIQVELHRNKDYGGRDLASPAHWVGDALNLPYKDGEVDYVYSSHLLEDFAAWRPALAEWTRVLKPGGHLVILIPDRERWARALANGQPPNGAHKHEGYAGELSTYADEMGWEVIEDRLTDLDPADYSILFVARKVVRVPKEEPRKRDPDQIVTCWHSGDLGDVLYALPAIRALAGNGMAELVMYRGPQEQLKYRVREPFAPLRAESLGALLAEQPYIRRWRFSEGPPQPGEADYDFAYWREEYTKPGNGTANLAYSQAEAFGVDRAVADRPWLTVRDPQTLGFNIEGLSQRLDVVVMRSHRYREPKFPWAEIADRFRERAVCVGSVDEYTALHHQYGFIYRANTRTLREVAQLIAGAKIVVTNQTAGRAIAEGLKHPCVLMERYAECPNVDFDRPGVYTGERLRAFLDNYRDETPPAPEVKPEPPKIQGVRKAEAVGAGA